MANLSKNKSVIMNRSRVSSRKSATSNSERIPRNVSLALKSANRQHNMESVLVKGPIDPPNIRRDIIVDKVVEVALTGATLSLTYANVYALLDASSTPFFSTMRVSKISAYGAPSATTIPLVSVSVFYDGAQFLDRGVGTARCPALHVRLPEALRIQWVATNSTNVIAQVGGAGAIVQVSIQVRADASADN